MLGSPQDLNHNGIKDLSEANLTTDDTVLVFEDYDGIIDTDGCHDSPGDDFDGDGFTDETEQLNIGTIPTDGCPATSALNDEPTDAWPPDFNDDQSVNIFDVNILRPAFFSTGPNPPYQARLDISPNNSIDIIDVNRLRPYFFTSCTP